MTQAPLVIKLGGAALECSETLTQLFKSIQSYQTSAKRAIVIVHGGGYLVDDLMNKLNLETVKKDGLRVTPYEQIPVIAGALAGTANKLLQGEAVKAGLTAIGLSLADGGLVKVEELDPELGAVGKASSGDATVLNAILNTAALPIISSIGLTNQGQLMNVNADQAAVAVAATLGADLALLSDVSGVLDAKGQLQKSLTQQQVDNMIAQKIITDGMIVKVRAALEAANDLGRPVEVATWRYPEKLVQLFSGESIGTCFHPAKQK